MTCIGSASNFAFTSRLIQPERATSALPTILSYALFTIRTFTLANSLMSTVDARILSDLFQTAYNDLQSIAHHEMRNQPPSHQLQPTALVSELYLKFTSSRPVKWRSYDHFLRTSARAMRQILIDHARTNRRMKRVGTVNGQPMRRVTLEAAGLVVNGDPARMMALEEALYRLERQAPEEGLVVELRIFADLQGTQIAMITGHSERQVDRLWQAGRSALLRWLRDD